MTLNLSDHGHRVCSRWIFSNYVTAFQSPNIVVNGFLLTNLNRVEMVHEELLFGIPHVKSVETLNLVCMPFLLSVTKTITLTIAS